MGFDDGIDFDDAMMEKFSSGDQRQEETAQKHVAHIRSHVVEVIHCEGGKSIKDSQATIRRLNTTAIFST